MQLKTKANQKREETHLPSERVNPPIYYFSCANCQKPLAEAIVTDEDKDFEWTVKAKCCYCGSYSFSKKLKGLLKYGGAVKVVSEDLNDYEDLTMVKLVPSKDSDGNDVITLETEDAKN